MRTFIILPNQLYFSHILKNLSDIDQIILWEHPHYFEKYNYNKKKLILHRASMKHIYDELKKKVKIPIQYIEVKKKIPVKISSITMFDPIDLIDLPNKPIHIIESPNFLLTRDDMSRYREKTDKFFFHSFYLWGKKQINVLPNIPSFDKMNRKKLPENLSPPSLSGLEKNDKKYIDEAIKYVEKNYQNNVGNTDNIWFPITRQTAEKWLDQFIKNKLSHFGDYQDYIDPEGSNLYHSMLSSSINIGLLNPSQIISAIQQSPHIKNVGMNNLEGYIRQLFWREYQRYCAIYIDFKGANYLGNKKKLGKEWYQGTTDILPLDRAIKQAFDTGYLHHILRLMVVGNLMNLMQIDPQEGFRWFMEFSVDSYEWVMYQNVLEMVFYVSGGLTMRRPYISSSNYILKMSHYPRGPWCDVWDKLYHQFVERNSGKIKFYR